MDVAICCDSRRREHSPHLRLQQRPLIISLDTVTFRSVSIRTKNDRMNVSCLTCTFKRFHFGMDVSSPARRCAVSKYSFYHGKLFGLAEIDCYCPGSVFPVVTDSWTRVWLMVELPQHCFSANFMPHRHRTVYNFSPTDYVSDALWFAYPGPVFVAAKHFNVHHGS